MSVTYGFFNAELIEGDYDRKYTADQLAEFFSYLIGNGISEAIENNFKVTESSGMDISVAAGFAWINGFWVKNNSSLILTDTVVPSSGYRKDLVVLRFNRTNRSITPMIIQGTVSQVSPASLPEYKRTSSEYDLVLAEIDLEAGESAITADMITDLRQDDLYCGVIDTLVAKLITSEMIEDRAVQTSKIALLAITTALLAEESVTSEKIAPANVTAAKLASDIRPSHVGIYMGTDDPTTETCPLGCIYLKYSEEDD